MLWIHVIDFHTASKKKNNAVLLISLAIVKPGLHHIHESCPHHIHDQNKKFQSLFLKQLMKNVDYNMIQNPQNGSLYPIL